MPDPVPQPEVVLCLLGALNAVIATTTQLDQALDNAYATIVGVQETIHTLTMRLEETCPCWRVA